MIPSAVSHQRYIVDELFPANEVHVIGGPSGSGKTTWNFQFMQDWIAGKPIHGFTSHPAPWYYLSCDRSMPGVFRTLDRMHLNLDRSRMASLIDNKEGIGLGTVRAFFLSIQRLLPSGGVLFIDGLAILSTLIPVGKDANYGAVAAFLMELARECQRCGITIIGTAHSPKVKENEKILNPRQKVLGSVAWAGCCETIVIIDPIDEDDDCDPTRVLLILPRNAPAIKVHLMFNDQGLLVEKPEAANVVLDFWLQTLDPGSLVSTPEIISIAAKKGIPAKRSVERWIKAARDDGRLENLHKGLYKKPYPA